MPDHARTRRQLLHATIALAAGAAGLGLLYFVNPSRSGFLPVCVLHVTTGLHCPGCGMTRAMHALLHGDMLAAVRFNALLVLALPVGGFALWRWWRRRPVRWPVGVAWGAFGLLIAFGIARNLPVYPFTLLAP
jgi:hypothetical protein